ncbi:MAG TPA: signal peptidase II [Patescibacteria group bacterium]
MRKFVFFTFVFLLLVFIDQAAKHLVFNANAGGFLNLLNPALGLMKFKNQYLAFSIHSSAIVMWCIYIVLLLGLSFWFWNQKDKSVRMAWAYVLILAGALSNIFDRLALGYVRDFVYIFWGNIFNLADLFIVAGILLLLFQKPPKEKS